MANYDLITCWQLAAPIDLVYRAISQPLLWPRWWQGLRRVELLDAGAEQGCQAGIGRIYRYHWRSRLGYPLCFDIRVARLNAPWLIVGQANGDVEGWGCWQLTEVAGGTRVRYRWRVCTRRRWMNLAAPLARPLFVWSHDTIMENGARGLSRLLQTARF